MRWGIIFCLQIVRLLCLLPLAVVTVAFFLLPMARLVVTGAEGPQGLPDIWPFSPNRATAPP